MAKLLIVDDEEKIREMISKYAQYEGHTCDLASNGKEAIKLFLNNTYDVVILDVMMPELNGYDTLKKMKEVNPDVHCIFLTALGEEYDRVYGFDLGADDYVTKPFSLKELMLRIKVILKRENKINEIFTVDKMIIDEAAHIVKIDDKIINLPNKEYELLLYLVKNQGVALARESIITKIWGYYYESDERTLDTHMKLLRKDIGEYSKYITTIRGMGYRFEKEI